MVNGVLRLLIWLHAKFQNLAVWACPSVCSGQWPFSPFTIPHFMSRSPWIDAGILGRAVSLLYSESRCSERSASVILQCYNILRHMRILNMQHTINDGTTYATIDHAGTVRQYAIITVSSLTLFYSSASTTRLMIWYTIRNAIKSLIGAHNMAIARVSCPRCNPSRKRLSMGCLKRRSRKWVSSCTRDREDVISQCGSFYDLYDTSKGQWWPSVPRYVVSICVVTSMSC